MAVVPLANDADARACIDGVLIEALARRLGTPLHVYSASAIRRRVTELQQALHGLDAQICYAVKANPNLAILERMAEAGIGADIVSAGELGRSLLAGIAPERIVFSGVGKSADEISAALVAGIARFNVESHDELLLLQRIAREHDIPAHASVRINPDVDARTHAKISTGRSENKFGVGLDEARRWFSGRRTLSHVCLDGLHVHIGSQMLDLQPLRLALQKVAAFRRELEAAGCPIACIDVGGGLGIAYRAGIDREIDVRAYVDVIRQELAGFDGRILLEPGRWLVAAAGVLLARVLRVKRSAQRNFLVLDAAMTELLRPSLYGAWHEIVRVGAEPRALTCYDIVGPVCESGDTFALAREMPECASGDLIAIRDTGAYAAAMASTYNSRPLAAEVLVESGRYAIVRRRQSFDEMIAGETRRGEWQNP
jgi:diaminopimelate decarboxylase